MDDYLASLPKLDTYIGSLPPKTQSWFKERVKEVSNEQIYKEICTNIRDRHLETHRQNPPHYLLAACLEEITQLRDKLGDELCEIQGIGDLRCAYLMPDSPLLINWPDAVHEILTQPKLYLEMFEWNMPREKKVFTRNSLQQARKQISLWYPRPGHL